MRSLRPFFALLLLLLAAVPESLAARRRAAATPQPLAVPQAEAIAAGALARGITGLTIAVRKGDALFLRSWGTMNLEQNVPVRNDSEYQIASISKQFAAAAIMRLVESGKLSLADSARKLVPELDPRYENATIRLLLQHRSGLPDYVAPLVASLHEPKTQREIIDIINTGTPYFAPGEGWLYSNSGYFVLAMIVERASGKTYEQFLRDAFFTPLALPATSVCGTRRDAPDGYILTANGALPFPAVDMSLMLGAGSLCSNASDLIRWNAALADGRAVSRASYEAMTGDLFTFLRETHYGYGLMTDAIDGRRRIWHNGSLPGFESHLAMFPDEDLSVAVLVNMSHGLRDLAAEIAEPLERSLKP